MKRCPNCGEELDYNEYKEFGRCKFCKTDVSHNKDVVNYFAKYEANKNKSGGYKPREKNRTKPAPTPEEPKEKEPIPEKPKEPSEELKATATNNKTDISLADFYDNVEFNTEEPKGELEEDVPKVSDNTELTEEAKEPQKADGIKTDISIDEEETLAYKAYHDALTGLKNREAYKEDIKEMSQGKLAIISIDVNNLKETNDGYGHEYGDKLLTTVANTLNKVFPDKCYRIGGDEFTVLLVGIGEKIIEKRLATLSDILAEITKNDEDGMIYEVAYGYAIGDGIMTKRELLDNADSRMYQKKKEQKKARKGQLTSSDKSKASEPTAEKEKPLQKVFSAIGKNEDTLSEDEMQSLSPAERIRLNKEKKPKKEPKEFKEKEEEKEVKDVVFHFNDDGYYNDTEPLEPPEPDIISKKTLLKAVGTVGGLVLATMFFIWYA